MSKPRRWASVRKLVRDWRRGTEAVEPIMRDWNEGYRIVTGKEVAAVVASAVAQGLREQKRLQRLVQEWKAAWALAEEPFGRVRVPELGTMLPLRATKRRRR